MMPSMRMSGRWLDDGRPEILIESLWGPSERETLEDRIDELEWRVRMLLLIVVFITFHA